MLFEMFILCFFTEEVEEKAGDLSCQNSPISFSPGCKMLLLLRTQRENTIGGLLRHSPNWNRLGRLIPAQDI